MNQWIFSIISTSLILLQLPGCSNGRLAPAGGSERDCIDHAGYLHVTSQVDTLGGGSGIDIDGNLLHVATGGGWYYIFDVSDPRRPAAVGRLRTRGEALDVSVSGKHAFIADGDSGLTVVDISDPRMPFLLAALPVPGQARAVPAAGGVTCMGEPGRGPGATMRKYANRARASPGKWVCMDIECDAGCGVVPFRYQDQSFVNALQWAIGLETFLLVDDPWRVFLTTDHPNGAPFDTYPHIIRLLMDKSFRNDMLATVNQDAAAASNLAAIDREYSLYEIAIMTRAGPARILGLSDYGHLGTGARADITVYTDQDNREAMFERPDYVFKSGELVVRDGEVVQVVWGTTHVTRPEYDRAIESSLAGYFDRYLTTRLDNFVMSDDEITGDGRGSITVHPCHKGGRA